MSNLKVEGKVGDVCLNCKNCKGIIQEYSGKNDSIRLTEVECVDPYDGMLKTLDADSDICCSMFEPRSDKFCENGIYVTSYMGLYEEEKEKEPCDKISCLQHELEMDKLRMKIHQLEKEKAAHMKGIERLKKSQEKLQNQVENLQKLERRLLEENKRFDRLDTEFLMPLAHVLYPGEKVCKPYSEILEDIKCIQNCLGKNTKLLADVNKEAVEWKDKYEAAMTGWKDAIDTNDKMIGEKDKQIEELTRRYNMIAKKLNDIHDILKEDPNNA